MDGIEGCWLDDGKWGGEWLKMRGGEWERKRRGGKEGYIPISHDNSTIISCLL
jgi:hypothetical protein